MGACFLLSEAGFTQHTSYMCTYTCIVQRCCFKIDNSVAGDAFTMLNVNKLSFPSQLSGGVGVECIPRGGRDPAWLALCVVSNAGAPGRLLVACDASAPESTSLGPRRVGGRGAGCRASPGLFRRKRPVPGAWEPGEAGPVAGSFRFSLVWVRAQGRRAPRPRRPRPRPSASSRVCGTAAARRQRSEPEPARRRRRQLW